jgi:hypothetical protein
MKVVVWCLQAVLDKCKHCSGLPSVSSASCCISTDCDLFYDRCRSSRTAQHMYAVLDQVGMMVSPAMHSEPRSEPEVIDLIDESD